MERLVVGGGELQGDGSALGETEDSESVGKFVFFTNVRDELEEERDFVFTKGGGIAGMFAVSWKVGDDAGEAGGAKAFGDGEVMFLATGVPVEKKECGGALCGRGFPFVELLSQELSFFTGDGEAFTKKVGGAVGGDVGGDLHAMGRGFGEDFVLGVVEACSLG